MKYYHTIKHNGILYPAGTEVPVGVEETPNIDERKVASEEELNSMKVPELKQLAEQLNISLEKTLKKDIIAEILEKQDEASNDK